MTTRRTDDERARALAVLGLPERATPREVTDRFRSLAKAMHPDTAAVAPDAARRLTAICDAYHLLARAEPPTAAQSTPPSAPRTPQQPAAGPSLWSPPSRHGPRPRPWLVAGPAHVRPLFAHPSHDAEART
jgi:hypothetical protein